MDTLLNKDSAGAMDDLTTYLYHLHRAGFNGTVMITFGKGNPTNLSRKEDLIIGQLADAMKRSVFVQIKKRPAVAPDENIKAGTEPVETVAAEGDQK